MALPTMIVALAGVPRQLQLSKCIIRFGRKLEMGGMESNCVDCSEAFITMNLGA